VQFHKQYVALLYVMLKISVYQFNWWRHRLSWWHHSDKARPLIFMMSIG